MAILAALVAVAFEIFLLAPASLLATVLALLLFLFGVLAAASISPTSY
jgi:hypothetical protein